MDITQHFIFVMMIRALHFPGEWEVNIDQGAARSVKRGGREGGREVFVWLGVEIG